MGTFSRTIAFVSFVLTLVAAPFGCTLLAPSDQELMGGVRTENEGGSEGGDAKSESGSDAACGATNATCSNDNQCCSGRCRGNSQCN